MGKERGNGWKQRIMGREEIRHGWKYSRMTTDENMYGGSG